MKQIDVDHQRLTAVRSYLEGALLACRDRLRTLQSIPEPATDVEQVAAGATAWMWTVLNEIAHRAGVEIPAVNPTGSREPPADS